MTHLEPAGNVMHVRHGASTSETYLQAVTSPDATSWSNRATIGVLQLALLCLGAATWAACGGACQLWLLETPGPGLEADREDRIAALMLAMLASAGCLACFWRLRRFHPRNAVFFVILMLLVGGVSLCIAEGLARTRLPGWPASDLHGLTPHADREPWGLQPSQPNSTRYNTWGQRDRERALSPPPGCRRIAFIGDSFLEDAVGDPLSVVVEDLLSDQNLEVVNLGVSATAPDEYYYRLRHVALPLRSAACIMFVYLGNDLAAEPRTLPTQLGVAAVTPRQSLLSVCRLRGLNHLLTNPQRPVLQTWFAAADLAAQEVDLHQRIRQGDDAQVMEIVRQQTQLSEVDEAALRERLQSPEMVPFFQMLREPDAGRFRSYYLADGAWLGATGVPPRIDDRINSVSHWVRQSAKLCRERKLPFLCVTIPEGFAVDPRMREQWRPLADMQQLTVATGRAGRRLADELRKLEIDVLELETVLDGVRGTYLNLDGHWSDLGVQISARAVARAIADRSGVAQGTSSADASLHSQ